MTRPFVLGLTGSIGMGKSTVAGMFEELGVPVFDADAVVRGLQGPGGGLVDEIERAFPGTTGPDGVDRARLGSAVFDDPAALARLEAIVHPAVRAARRRFLDRHRETFAGNHRMARAVQGLDRLKDLSALVEQEDARGNRAP